MSGELVCSDHYDPNLSSITSGGSFGAIAVTKQSSQSSKSSGIFSASPDDEKVCGAFVHSRLVPLSDT